jgi:hypothetical protein
MPIADLRSPLAAKPILPFVGQAIVERGFKT